MPILPLVATILIERLRIGVMGVKLGSVVMVLMFFFIAKISFESATGGTSSHELSQVDNERSPASIDQSYHDHMNKH